MSEYKPEIIDDEINLKDLSLTLWRGKYIIFAISVLAVVLSSNKLRNTQETYSVQAVFKPVVEASGGPNLSGFSSLASLAGISLPKSNSSDFTTYRKLIFSEEVAEKFFINQELVVKLFKSEWNSDSGSFEPPTLGQISIFKQRVKSAVTGIEKRNYIPPNPKRLSILMDETFQISVDNETGFISITTETSRPDLMVALLSIASQATDKLLKDRFFDTAEDTLEFYYQKLLTSRSPEHRETLAKLISVQDQKLMLASKSSNFVAEPLTRPSVSLYPTSPRPSFVLALGLVLGIFSGIAIVLILHIIKIPKAT